MEQVKAVEHTRSDIIAAEHCPHCGAYETESLDVVYQHDHAEVYWKCSKCETTFTDVFAFSHKADIVTPPSVAELLLDRIEKALEALQQARSEIEGGSKGENESLCLASILVDEAYKKTLDLI